MVEKIAREAALTLLGRARKDETQQLTVMEPDHLNDPASEELAGRRLSSGVSNCRVKNWISSE